MAGSSPRNIDWTDDSTVLLKSKAEARLLLNALDENLGHWQKNYAHLISEGMPESHPAARDARSIIWGHAAMLRKLSLIYAAFHGNDCADPINCALGNPDNVSEQREAFRTLMRQIEQIDLETQNDKLPGQDLAAVMARFFKFIQGA